MQRRSLPIAGSGSRLMAYIMDWFILTIVQYVVGLATGVIVVASLRTVMLESLILRWFIQSLAFWTTIAITITYFVYFTAKGGQTPGKRALGIKVVKENGGKLNLKEVILREVIGKFISELVFGLGFIWILFDKKKQGWHDKIARTVVIRA